MKKILSAFLAGVIILSLTACGDNNNEQDNSPVPPDLSGQWKQVNSESEDSYQGAIIEDDVIEIYWVSNGGDTHSLYWSGTFDAPDTAEEPYVWESKKDEARTSHSVMSSGDDTKTFTYENGQISYSSSIMGTTTKVRLEKEEWEPGLEVVKIEPPDLSGQWRQVNSDTEDRYYSAVISDDKIEVYSVYYKDNSRYLFWSGSFDAPSTIEEPYSWTSQNGTERTNLSLIASRDDTKDFTYESGQISFPIHRPSTESTFTVQMVQEEWAPDLGIGEFDEATYFPFSIAGIEFSLPSYYEKNLELSKDTEVWFTSILGSIIYFLEIDVPGTQKDFDESIDDITRSIAGKYQEEIEYSEDILLAGLPARFIIVSDPDNERTSYTAFTYNENEEKFLAIMLFSTLPTNEKDYSIYFNHILNSAKLLESEKPTEPSTSTNGIRPEFKEAMDSYEAFFDEYADFMKKFSSSGNTLGMLADYSKFMDKYTETMEALDKLGEEDMSPEETKYYTEAMLRINQKLLDAVA